MVEFSAERMVKIEEREKSNSHRIDKLEGLAEAIHRQNENIARLVEKLEATNNALAAYEARLSEIEKLPQKRGEAAISSSITALASAIAGALVTLLFGVAP
jgi:predicted  nucleic acid-binding Zn-ribbon protein